MPIPVTLPNALITMTRDQVRAKWLRDYSLRNPTAQTGVGTDPYTDSAVFADGIMPIYANSVTIASNVPRSTKTGASLDAEAIAMGQPVHLPAIGASGSVVISTSTAGATIFANDELRINGLRYKCVLTSTYANGSQVPVAGIDTGIATNVAPGTIGTWTNPRPGCAPTATVALQADGSGLTNGSDVESDPHMQLRLAQAASNPPASGNDAAFIQAVMKTPLVAIEQPFVHPSILGPGTIAVAFTVRKSAPGGSRIPNATQLAQVAAWLNAQMPADDTILVVPLVASQTDVAMKVTWGSGSTWTDAVTFPTYAASLVTSSVVVSSTSFSLNNVVTGPQVGQSIGFYDNANQVFRRKKILTASNSGGGVWVITCDPTNGASDTSYTPFVGQPCCPWSDSLNLVVPATVAYFDGLGPGEQVSSFFDPGLRQRRDPASPALWPSEVSNRMLAGLFAVPQIANASLSQPTVPYPTPVGTPGVSSNLIVLRAITVFPT